MYKSLEEFRRNYCFTYIDVGARRAVKSTLLKLFPNSTWIGFEPAIDECALINSKKQNGQECFPYALSDKSGIQTLYITKSPDWSSLYEPNPEIFIQFKGLKDFYKAVDNYQVSLKSLDELIKSSDNSLANADYMKLDTQGSEADILNGSQVLISTSIIGVEVEVEFIPLYKKQPLFDQIHKVMMDNGFLLFDLKRSRCIRSGFTTDIDTKGQLIWGDALYLKDFSTLITNNNYDKLLVLLLVAMELGFPDYSVSILKAMLANKIVSTEIQQEVHQLMNRLGVRQRRKAGLVEVIAKLPNGRKFLKYLRRLIDDNYEHIVKLGFPEYYFRRD